MPGRLRPIAERTIAEDTLSHVLAAMCTNGSYRRLPQVRCTPPQVGFPCKIRRTVA